MTRVPTLVEKRCEWNRYCSYLAPFYSEHLLEIGANRPLVIGRCYNCGAFVCNRCAFRRSYESAAEARFLEPRELLCPVDGGPLGRGGNWIVFGGAEESIRRSATPPGHSLIYEAFVKGIVLVNDAPETIAIRQSLEKSFEMYGNGDYESVLSTCASVLELSRTSVNALLLRRSALERLRRFDEAWETLRQAPQANRDELIRALGELNALESISEQTRDAFSQEILAQLKQIAPVTSRDPELDALYNLVDRLAPDLVRSVLGESAGPANQSPPSASATGAASSERVVSQQQVSEVTTESCRYNVDVSGAPARLLVTSVPSDLLQQILSELPRDSWTNDDWARFVGQCADKGSVELPVGCDEFANRIWNLTHGHELAGSPLTAQLLVEFPSAVLQLESPELIDLFAMYARECFQRAPRIRHCLKEASDPLLVGEQIAGELFQTGTASDTGMLARKLEEIFSAGATIEEWVAALQEYVQVFPMLVESTSEIGFAHRCFEESFVASYLFRSLFQPEKPAFKIAGARCFSRNTAIFLANLVMRDAGHHQLLEEWLQMKRQRRSLFRGADVPTFVRNLALVRLVVRGDASSLDLTDADFSGLDLRSANFNNADLTGASFRNARLRGASFRGCVLTGTSFDEADLTESIFDQSR